MMQCILFVADAVSHRQVLSVPWPSIHIVGAPSRQYYFRIAAYNRAGHSTTNVSLRILSDVSGACLSHTTTMCSTSGPGADVPSMMVGLSDYLYYAMEAIDITPRSLPAFGGIVLELSASGLGTGREPTGYGAYGYQVDGTLSL